MKVKCSDCGYVKESIYLHDVCPKCHGSMHHKPETSLLEAISKKDKKLIKEIEKRAMKGEIVRII